MCLKSLVKESEACIFLNSTKESDLRKTPKRSPENESMFLHTKAGTKLDLSDHLLVLLEAVELYNRHTCVSMWVYTDVYVYIYIYVHVFLTINQSRIRYLLLLKIFSPAFSPCSIWRLTCILCFPVGLGPAGDLEGETRGNFG